MSALDYGYLSSSRQGGGQFGGEIAGMVLRFGCQSYARFSSTG
jgi:hypothetical protein